MKDTIDRQEAIAHLKKRLIETAINNVGVIARCDSIFGDTADNRIGPWLNELPSAQPERKRGKWIEDDDGWDGVIWRCSECDALFALTDGTPEENEYNFCPHCGADMREVDDE